MAATSELSDRWRDPAFVDAAHAWIAARLAEHDRAVVGTIEQPHVTDWSTVMRVPTGDGPVWFKANDETMRHEAAVTALIAPLSAGRVPEPLAGEVIVDVGASVSVDAAAITSPGCGVTGWLDEGFQLERIEAEAVA